VLADQQEGESAHRIKESCTPTSWKADIRSVSMIIFFPFHCRSSRSSRRLSCFSRFRIPVGHHRAPTSRKKGKMTLLLVWKQHERNLAPVISYIGHYEEMDDAQVLRRSAIGTRKYRALKIEE
jgi:hypothetical protein